MEETGTYDSLGKLFQFYLDSEKTDRYFRALFQKLHPEEKQDYEQAANPGFNAKKRHLPDKLIGGKIIYRKEDVDKLLE
ncbi:MAG: hypothetical protein IH595_03550 [Bacteroidales bacterium]|nr:hypothetical protein [Bacteroidales bacterium]